ncbi:MAG: hypothetical protein Q9209_001225 [Squamulea sp. 1 TL-2023]
MEEADEGAEDCPSKLPELSSIIESSLPSPSPPKKRRRIDTTNPLNKPFKSPFRTPLKPSSTFEANKATPGSVSNTQLIAHSKALPISVPTTISTPSHSSRPLPSFLSTSPTKPGFDLDKLQKHHTLLLNTLSSIRARLETTNQALEIEASDTDAELDALIKKWRGVSKEAAEEVFVGMKEKVDGMGGWKKWRSREVEGARGWDDGEDENANDRGDRADREEEGTEERKERKRNERAEEEQAEKEEEDDEGFTMERMLKSLDIPLETIGYDNALQRWND